MAQYKIGSEEIAWGRGTYNAGTGICTISKKEVNASTIPTSEDMLQQSTVDEVLKKLVALYEEVKDQLIVLDPTIVDGDMVQVTTDVTTGLKKLIPVTYTETVLTLESGVTHHPTQGDAKIRKIANGMLIMGFGGVKFKVENYKSEYGKKVKLLGTVAEGFRPLPNTVWKFPVKEGIHISIYADGEVKAWIEPTHADGESITAYFTNLADSQK